MSKAAVISARIDPDLKKRVEHVLEGLGMTTSQAIGMFFRQIDIQNGLPFEVKLVERESKRSVAELDAYWVDVDQLAASIAAQWPTGLSASEAVSADRRDLAVASRGAFQ